MIPIRTHLSTVPRRFLTLVHWVWRYWGYRNRRSRFGRSLAKSVTLCWTKFNTLRPYATKMGPRVAIGLSTCQERRESFIACKLLQKLLFGFTQSFLCFKFTGTFQSLELIVCV